MRVIAGTARGRRLAVPPGRAVRPTSDRVREALYSILGDVAGLRVLDAWAGTGALGIEALSRGAARATFVEQAGKVAEVLRGNLRTAGVDDVAAVVVADVLRWAQDPPRRTPPLRRGEPTEPFDLVLADPPYAVPAERVGAVVAGLRDAGRLAPDAVVVVERDRRTVVPPPAAVLALRSERTYGDTVLQLCGVVASGKVAP